MNEPKEILLPSGATLKIRPAPFAEAKALYQALLAEVKEIKIESETAMVSIFKDIFCAGFSSQKIEKELEKCLARCTYNGGNGDMKIDKDTFEPMSAREDYTLVCMEVAKENIAPFAKSLYAEYSRILKEMQGAQA